MKNLLNNLGLSFLRVVKREKAEKVKFVADKRQELLIRLGREQFQKLVDKGLSLQVG